MDDLPVVIGEPGVGGETILKRVADGNEKPDRWPTSEPPGGGRYPTLAEPRNSPGEMPLQSWNPSRRPVSIASPSPRNAGRLGPHSRRIP